MQQRTKNIRLLSLLAITLVTIGLLLRFDRNSDTLGVDKKLFQLNDQQEITDVYLLGPDEQNHFHFEKGQWHLNDTLLLDQSMATVFFSVLSRLEIRRPVARQEADSLAALLRSQGVRTIITYGADTIKDYFVGGNPDLEITWMLNHREATPWQVHIPGYQSYVAGIFSVPASDWRSRFVFTTNFALLSRLRLIYPDDSLVIRQKNNFFEIPGITADSTAIANYLEEVAYLQADRYLTPQDTAGTYHLYLQQPHWAGLQLQTATGRTEEVVFLQRPAGKPYLVGILSDGTPALFKYQRIKGIFKTKQEFTDE